MSLSWAWEEGLWIADGFVHPDACLPACQQGWLGNAPAGPETAGALQQSHVPEKVQERAGRVPWGLGCLNSGLEILYPVQRQANGNLIHGKKKIYWRLDTVS